MKPNELTMMNFHHGQQASAVGSDAENQFWCDGCGDQFKSVVVFEIVLVDTIDATVQLSPLQALLSFHQNPLSPALPPLVIPLSTPSSSTTTSFGQLRLDDIGDGANAPYYCGEVID
jgi:hypothetical protein